MFYHGNIPGFTIIWENIFGTFSRHQIQLFFCSPSLGEKMPEKTHNLGGRMSSLWQGGHWHLSVHWHLKVLKGEAK